MFDEQAVQPSCTSAAEGSSLAASGQQQQSPNAVPWKPPRAVPVGSRPLPPRGSEPSQSLVTTAVSQQTSSGSSSGSSNGTCSVVQQNEGNLHLADAPNGTATPLPDRLAPSSSQAHNQKASADPPSLVRGNSIDSDTCLLPEGTTCSAPPALLTWRPEQQPLHVDKLTKASSFAVGPRIHSARSFKYGHTTSGDVEEMREALDPARVQKRRDRNGKLVVILGAIAMLTVAVGLCMLLALSSWDWQQLLRPPAPAPPAPVVCSPESQPFVTKEPMRSWQLSSSSLEACRTTSQPPDLRMLESTEDDRNWCWTAYKDKCHGYLKNHHPWAHYQDLAAEEGRCPLRQAEPFAPLKDPDVCDVAEHGRSRNWTAEERETASKWFSETVKVYVLNLPTDASRWNMISRRMKELDIPIERVFGVDMHMDNALKNAQDNGWVPASWNFTHAQFVSYSRKQNWEGSILGTVGWASAHFKAQAQVMEDGFPLGIVLEDDSWVEDDFVERLWSLVVDELPCDWEVTALLSRCPYGQCVSSHLARIQPDANEPAWTCRAGVNWGMHGMLYRTASLAHVQKHWKGVVFNERRPHCLDVDVALASISDRVGFYAVPSVQDPGLLREADLRSARRGGSSETASAGWHQ